MQRTNEPIFNSRGYWPSHLHNVWSDLDFPSFAFRTEKYGAQYD